MSEQEFQTAFPLIAGWIQKTLADHATAAQPVTSFGFDRLPHYYDQKILASAKVVIVPMKLYEARAIISRLCFPLRSAS